MFKRVLFPLIKKKILLFISLIFICVLGVSCATGFISVYFDIKKSANEYLNDYGIPDIALTINKDFSDDEVKDFKIDGASIFYRYQFDTYIKIHHKSFKSRVTTFDKESFSKRYVLSEVNDSTSKINLNVDYVFANNNNIKASEEATLLINETPVDVFINKIVGNPEAIQPSIGGNVPRDQYDFGCTYIDKSELKASGLSIKNNEVIVKITDQNKTKESIRAEIQNKLAQKSMRVTSCTYKENNPSYRQTNSTIEDLKKASVYVPLITISILIIMIILFMFQISKSLTHEFGIMMALGVSYKAIYSILLGFACFVSIISSIFGVFLGHGLSLFIYSKMKSGFGIPLGYGGVLFNISFIAIIINFLITLFAVSLTMIIIKKINPKEAINSGKDIYKPLPKTMENIVDKAGISSKIAIASIFKEKVRSFVSIFTIMATFAVCFSSYNLYKSESGLINELYNRNNFEAEVYILDNNKIDEIKTFILEEKNQGIIKEFEYVKTAYLKFNDKGSAYTICGINNSDMHIIKNAKNERLYIDQDDAIILDELYAKEGNYQKGDKIKINGFEILVKDIAHECSYKKNYMSYNTLTKIVTSGKASYQESIVLNSNNLTKFVNDISLQFSKIHVLSTEKFLLTATKGHQAIVLLTIVLLIIGALVGVTTLSIMAIISNMEQKRKFSIMRALGLKISDVSNVIFIQNATFIFFGLLFGIPSGYFLGKALVNICTTKHNALINFNYCYFYLIISILIIFISLIAHFISLINIKHTNIVENVCSRE